MQTPTTDPHTKWKPVNADAAKIIRPAGDEDVLTERIQHPPAMTNKSHTAKVLVGKEPILRTGQKVGNVTIEGINVKGRVLGQCDCGAWELFAATYLLTSLVAKRKRAYSPMCSECRMLEAAVNREAETGIRQVLAG